MIIALPYQRSARGAFIVAETELEMAESEIYSVLNTVKGERVMIPDYGINVVRYLFEQDEAVVADGVRREVYNSITTWVPRVNVLQVKVERLPDETNNAIQIYAVFQLKADEESIGTTSITVS